MKRGLLVVVLGVALSLFGCGGSSDDESGDPSGNGGTTETTAEVPVPSTRAEGSVTRSEVGVGDQVDLGNGLLVTVDSVVATELGANVPGEVAGPGVIVTVSVENTTSDEVDLVGFVVNARSGDGDGAPASPNPTAGVSLEGTLAPGETATGTYAFRVVPDQQGTVVVEIEHALFTGVAVVKVGDDLT